MVNILMIETSTKKCSVAISQNGKLLDSIEEVSDKYLHSEKLHPFIDELLKRNKISPQDLSAVAVSKGPGSYTGLRIGVSASKGLAYALDIPVITLSSLEILARGVKLHESGFIIPMIDARRMEAYTAVFDKNYLIVRDIRAEILNENSFAEFLENNKVYFVGDAVAKAENVISHPQAVFTSHQFPAAADMAEPAWKKWLNNEFENTAYFEPFYLKDFIAKKKKNIFDKK